MFVARAASMFVARRRVWFMIDCKVPRVFFTR